MNKNKLEEKEYTMIPKDQMIDCMWYNGVCRNANFAMWDKDIGKFRHFRNKFGWFMEEIKHFEDVKDDGVDGFIPIEEVHPLNYKILRSLKEKVGY